MKKFKFKKIDAFASGLSSGNPAAAIYHDNFQDISEFEKDLRGNQGLEV